MATKVPKEITRNILEKDFPNIKKYYEKFGSMTNSDHKEAADLQCHLLNKNMTWNKQPIPDWVAPMAILACLDRACKSGSKICMRLNGTEGCKEKECTYRHKCIGCGEESDKKTHGLHNGCKIQKEREAYKLRFAMDPFAKEATNTLMGLAKDLPAKDLPAKRAGKKHKGSGSASFASLRSEDEDEDPATAEGGNQAEVQNEEADEQDFHKVKKNNNKKKEVNGQEEAEKAEEQVAEQVAEEDSQNKQKKSKAASEEVDEQDIQKVKKKKNNKKEVNGQEEAEKAEKQVAEQVVEEDSQNKQEESEAASKEVDEESFAYCADAPGPMPVLEAYATTHEEGLDDGDTGSTAPSRDGDKASSTGATSSVRRDVAITTKATEKEYEFRRRMTKKFGFKFTQSSDLEYELNSRKEYKLLEEYRPLSSERCSTFHMNGPSKYSVYSRSSLDVGTASVAQPSVIAGPRNQRPQQVQPATTLQSSSSDNQADPWPDDLKIKDVLRQGPTPEQKRVLQEEGLVIYTQKAEYPEIKQNVDKIARSKDFCLKKQSEEQTMATVRFFDVENKKKFEREWQSKLVPFVRNVEPWVPKTDMQKRMKIHNIHRSEDVTVDDIRTHLSAAFGPVMVIQPSHFWENGSFKYVSVEFETVDGACKLKTAADSDKRSWKKGQVISTICIALANTELLSLLVENNELLTNLVARPHHGAQESGDIQGVDQEMLADPAAFPALEATQGSAHAPPRGLSLVNVASGSVSRAPTPAAEASTTFSSCTTSAISPAAPPAECQILASAINVTVLGPNLLPIYSKAQMLQIFTLTPMTMPDGSLPAARSSSEPFGGPAAGQPAEVTAANVGGSSSLNPPGGTLLTFLESHGMDDLLQGLLTVTGLQPDLEEFLEDLFDKEGLLVEADLEGLCENPEFRCPRPLFRKLCRKLQEEKAKSLKG